MVLILAAKDPQTRGHLLEDITKDVLCRLGYTDVRTRQRRSGEELDVIAKSPPIPPETDSTPVFGECKATARQVDMKVWDGFMGKLYKQRAMDRRTIGLLIALSGVTSEVRDNYTAFRKAPEGKGVVLLESPDIVSLFERTEVLPTEESLLSRLKGDLRKRHSRSRVVVGKVKGHNYIPIWYLTLLDDRSAEAYCFFFRSSGALMTREAVASALPGLPTFEQTLIQLEDLGEAEDLVVSLERERSGITAAVESGNSENTHLLPDSATSLQIAEALTSLANTKGGVLILGARKGKIQGAASTDKMVNAVHEATSHRRCNPELTVEPPRVLTVNGCKVVVVSVPRAEIKVCLSDGRCLVRHGDRIKPHFSIFHDQSIETTTFADCTFKPDSLDADNVFSRRKISEFRERVAREKPGIANLDDQAVLLRYCCISRRDGLDLATVAGLLMFGVEAQRHIPHAGVVLVRFPGTDVSPETDLHEDRLGADGTIPELVDQSLSFIRRNTRAQSRTPSETREDIYEYPLAAIREAVVNALVHRDYFIKAPVRILIFDDRIEVISPGSLPPGVTLERMRAGEMQHVARNAVLAEMMRYSPGYEGIGQGIRRMIDSLRSGGYSDPDFEELGEAFRVTIRSDRSIPSAPPAPQEDDLSPASKRTVDVGPRAIVAEASDVKPLTVERIPNYEEMIFLQTSRMGTTIEKARKIAASDLPCLITGETGTGKTLLAERMHLWSARANGPFVVVLLSAVPRELLLTELFGHKRGAFTGATRDRYGLVRNADRGTLFLDEIADTPLEVQSVLLHLMDKGTVRSVGSDREEQVDIRIIGASNRDIKSLVHEGRFREDLFHRLAQATVNVPRLGDRGREEFQELVEYFLRKQQHVQTNLRPEVIDFLYARHWPGNIRELQSILMLAHVLCGDTPLTVELLADIIEERGSLDSPLQPQDIHSIINGRTFREARTEFERAYFTALGEHHGGVFSRMATAAGIDKKTLMSRLKEYGLLRSKD